MYPAIWRRTVSMRTMIKPFVPGFAMRARQQWIDMRQLWLGTRSVYPRHCPVCDFQGAFKAHGSPPRVDGRCPSCGSLERHRLLWLWMRQHHARLDEPVLHFAPEPVLAQRFGALFKQYVTADLFRRADIKLNIERIDKPQGSVGTVICNHVLEHVDDFAALSELHRILQPGGRLVVSAPIVWGWGKTYEAPEAVTPQLKLAHYGHPDHRRYYGRDFIDRVLAAGFLLEEEVTAEGPSVLRHALLRGEKFFIFNKPARNQK